MLTDLQIYDYTVFLDSYILTTNIHQEKFKGLNPNFFCCKGPVFCPFFDLYRLTLSKNATVFPSVSGVSS